jgi:hypothetical protein
MSGELFWIPKEILVRCINTMGAIGIWVSYYINNVIGGVFVWSTLKCLVSQEDNLKGALI